MGTVLDAGYTFNRVYSRVPMLKLAKFPGILTPGKKVWENVYIKPEKLVLDKLKSIVAVI